MHNWNRFHETNDHTAYIGRNTSSESSDVLYKEMLSFPDSEDISSDLLLP